MTQELCMTADSLGLIADSLVLIAESLGLIAHSSDHDTDRGFSWNSMPSFTYDANTSSPQRQCHDLRGRQLKGKVPVA